MLIDVFTCIYIILILFLMSKLFRC